MASKVEESIEAGGSKPTRRSTEDTSSSVSPKRLCINVSGRGVNLYDPTYFGSFITTQYGLIRLIFDYLTWFDLKIASQVCSDWKNVAEFVLKDRTSIHWMHWSHKEDTQLEDYVEKFIRTEILSNPKLFVVFLPHNREARRKLANDSVCSEVWREVRNTSSSFPMFWVDGIVGTKHSDWETVEIERRRKSLSAFIMPDIPGVTVDQLFLDPKFFCVRDPIVKNDSDALLKAIGYEPKDVRCVLIFVKDYSFLDNGLVSSFISAIQDKQKENFAVGGAIVEDMMVCGHDNPAFIALVFSGENVVSSSLIVNRGVKSKEGTSLLLQKMSESNIPGDKGIGFMFSCLGRGKQWYNGEENVESGLFRQHFPNVPVVGLFGNGEIGWTDFSGNPSKRNVTVDIVHSYATSFVYLGFKVPKKKVFK